MSDTARANADLTGFQVPQVIASRAFKREAVADDVVGAAVFLASADSAFITGQTLIVDGAPSSSSVCYPRCPWRSWSDPSPCPLPLRGEGIERLPLPL